MLLCETLGFEIYPFACIASFQSFPEYTVKLKNALATHIKRLNWMSFRLSTSC